MVFALAGDSTITSFAILAFTAVQAPPLTDAERKVLACAGGEAVSLEELAARCGMQAAALAPVLMRLELSGRVKMLPGQRYIFL